MPNFKEPPRTLFPNILRRTGECVHDIATDLADHKETPEATMRRIIVMVAAAYFEGRDG